MNAIRRLVDKLLVHKWELLLVLVLLAVVGTAHAVNMFHYPYYEDDEGTYMAQAWSFAEHAKLAPYTYWYDHAPVGWMFLALWVKLTGVFTFGFSINSGRVFIWLLFLASALFVYLAGRKLTGSKAAATLATLLFAFAPLTFALQRRVLLDNIMVFWLLASVVLILYSRQRLGRLVASGFLFGIAVLSKESAAFLWPAMIYLVYAYTDKRIRKQALTMWILTSGLFVFLYPLMALVKDEFFPAVSANSCTKSHVSLLGTLEFQSQRGTGAGIGFWSNFWSNFLSWLHADPLVTLSGFASLGITLVIGIWRKAGLAIAILGLFYVAFLARGGEDIYFYILPLVPFLGLAIAYVVWSVASVIRRPRLAKALPYLLFVVLAVVVWARTGAQQFRDSLIVDQTSAQVKAVQWMLKQHAPDRFYAIDMYAYVDLHAKNDGNFGHAEYYWKVAGDPAIYNDLLHDNYKRIDYIMATPQLSSDTYKSDLYLLIPALKGATPVTSFDDQGGWNVTVYRVNTWDPAAGRVSPPFDGCTQ